MSTAISIFSDQRCATVIHVEKPRGKTHMALYIRDDCINCSVCEAECPNRAISEGAIIYGINPDLCTECLGHFDEPQCVRICPIDCIIPDPQRQESEVILLQRYAVLTGQQNRTK